MLDQRSLFFEPGTAQIKITFVIAFGHIAMLFVPFPSYPLHAPQAGLQKAPITTTLITTTTTHKRWQVIMMHICSGLVGPKSEDVEAPLVFQCF